MAIGLIASLSIDVQSDHNLERVIISQTFWLPKLILQDAYLVQMKLASIILRKMDREERHSNEFAVKLQERIEAYKEEFGANEMLPTFNDAEEGGDTSTASVESENAAELDSLLSSLVENQVNLLER